MAIFTETLLNSISRLSDYRIFGRVASVQGLLVEVGGIHTSVSVGDRVVMVGRQGRRVLGEVVGFRQGHALLMPFGTLDGIGLGARAELGSSEPAIYPHPSWLGRVVNAMGEAIDDKGPLATGTTACPIRHTPPAAHTRQRVGGKLDLGIRCINAFTTCCVGQRMGIFSASGVGKSSVMSMMARYSAADVIVCGLIGERGREAREFIEDDLGASGLERSVVVVSTSDEPPLMRRQAAYMTLAVAEYFRDQGKEVLCLMDSVTRFAMAQREISLSAGEPPANKGYTPSVFAELPKLLERAGPGGPHQGNITGLFTVLVEGDDHNEPVSDTVRGILDGHIVLDRGIAERGRYPAMNILKSVSRTMPTCNTPEQNDLIRRCRRILAVYEDMSELIRLGAYRQGSNAEVDEAIQLYPRIEAVLQQDLHDCATLEKTYAALQEAIQAPPPAPPAA